MSVAHRGVIPHSRPLAQHLDTALAACDELLTGTADAQSLLRLELTAITHILQARQTAAETFVDDGELRRRLAYFVMQTDVLEVAGSNQLKGPRPSGERLLGGRIALSGLTALLASLVDAVDCDKGPEVDRTGDAMPRSPQSQEAPIWTTAIDGGCRFHGGPFVVAKMRATR